MQPCPAEKPPNKCISYDGPGDRTVSLIILLPVWCPTTSLWSLLAKSKAGRMDLNLLRISLCLVMSVARMHLQPGQNKRWTLVVLP